MGLFDGRSKAARDVRAAARALNRAVRTDTEGAHPAECEALDAARAKLAAEVGEDRADDLTDLAIEQEH